jgi:hypothetical protein
VPPGKEVTIVRGCRVVVPSAAVLHSEIQINHHDCLTWVQMSGQNFAILSLKCVIYINFFVSYTCMAYLSIGLLNR